MHFASNAYAQAFQYCDGNPKSMGDRGFITLYGDRSITAIKTLTASALPLNSVWFFINGDGFANPGGSLGVLCVGGSIGRYSASAASSGSTGTISLPIDPTMLQTPNGPVPAMVGQFWQFQLWHRDSVGGMAESNFDNACTILFR